MSPAKENEKKNYKQKINLYAWDGVSSFDEDDSDSHEVLFVDMESKDEPSKYEKGYLEHIDNIEEVEFEGESICAQEEIERLRKKNNLLKEQLK